MVPTAAHGCPLGGQQVVGCRCGCFSTPRLHLAAHLVPTLVQAHGHGADEGLDARGGLRIVGSGELDVVVMVGGWWRALPGGW